MFSIVGSNIYFYAFTSPGGGGGGGGERNGSVVECLTRDRGATGSSLTGVVVLEQDTFILA